MEKTIEYVLRERYNLDSSIAYGCSEEELQILLSLFGEEVPIIDALNVLAGASFEQRARDIGCSPEDFHGWHEGESDGDGDGEKPVSGGGGLPVWEQSWHSKR